MAMSVYRMYGGYRIQVIGTSALFAVVAGVVFGSTVSGAGPGWPFTILWVAAVVFVSQGFLWRVAYEIRLEGDKLVWKTPLRSGTAPLAEIRRLRPAPWGRNAELVELGTGKRITILVRKGFQSFIQDLAAAAPGVPIEVSPFFSKLHERSAGSGGYEHWD